LRFRPLLAAIPALVALSGASAAAAASPEQQLANRYAPVVALVDQAKPCARGEAWRPTTVDIVLGNPEVTLRGPGSGNPVVKRAPSAADLFGKGEGYYLNFPGNPNIPRCTFDRDGKQFARGRPSIAYAHIVTRAADQGVPGDRGRLALQYWFFYYFNDYNDKHEADWEGIQLVFPAATASAALHTEPVDVGYAQHGGGERAHWASKKVQKVGTRPVVYAASGSHASYYSSALWLGTSADEGVGCDDTRGPSHRVPLGAVLVPSRAESRSSPYAWLNYDGHWGQKLPGANNGPTGPNTKGRWTDPFSWQDGIRSGSISLPAGETLGPSITGAFCGTAAALSSVLTYFYNSPRLTILILALVLAAVLALVIWLVRRSTWSSAGQDRIRTHRSIGQILRASARIYWSRRWLFLGLGLFSVIVFVAVRSFEALLRLAFSPLGDVTIRLSGTALAALAVNAAVAVAVDRLARHRRVKVLRTYALVLRRALPLLGAIVLEGIVVVLVALVVISIPLVLSLLVAELGAAVLVVLVLLAVWLLAYALVGWAFTSQEVCLEGSSAVDAVRDGPKLVKGNWWRSAILLVTLYVIGIAAGPIVGFAVLFATPLDPRLLDLIGSAVYVVVFPFVAIAATLLFFDLKKRREDAAAPKTT
jgi:hypothetical protein